MARLVRHAVNRGNVLEGPLRDRIADGRNPVAKGRYPPTAADFDTVKDGPPSTLSGPSWPDRQPTGVDQGAAIRHASAHVATADGGRPEPACYAVDRFPPEAQS